jgi:hypothetical protein
MRFVATALLAASLLAAADAGAQATTATRKYQCWTDASGQRACGDRVPPEYASEERQVFDRQGRVVETRPRQKTAEELAEENRRVAEAAAAKRRIEEAAAYDRFLLDTYSSGRDLERARDERFATLDSRLRLTEKAVADDEKALAGLEARVDALLQKDKEPDATLKKQLRNVKRTLHNNRTAIERIKADRIAIDAKFSQDILRYQQLRFGIEAAGGEPEAAAPAVP